MPSVRISDSNQTMRDIEALLIRAMALTNVAQMNFAEADEWAQIKTDEAGYYLEKISG